MKGTSELNDSFRSKRDAMAKQIQASNIKKKDKEKREQGDKRVGVNQQNTSVEINLGDTLDDIQLDDSLAEHDKVEKFLKESSTATKVADGQLSCNSDIGEGAGSKGDVIIEHSKEPPGHPPADQVPVMLDVGGENSLGEVLPLDSEKTAVLDKTLEKIFGSGASLLADELESGEGIVGLQE